MQDTHGSMWMKCFKLHRYDRVCHAERYRVDTSLYQFIDSDWCTVSVFLCRPDTNTFLVVQESHLHAGECCAQYYNDVHMHPFWYAINVAQSNDERCTGMYPLSCTTAMPLKQTHCLVTPKPLQVKACAANAICVLD